MSLMTSPFPPIADYAFLSDCHTGALIAPDGSVDWLCVPAFDSPSIFGNLLDRGAGSFRFGPDGINVPNARTYVPGTNVLLTTWHAPAGWVEVRDALTMCLRTGPDLVTPHTRPPTDVDAEHMLVRTVRCLEGSVEVELFCEPLFDYGREVATWPSSRRQVGSSSPSDWRSYPSRPADEQLALSHSTVVELTSITACDRITRYG